MTARASTSLAGLCLVLAGTAACHRKQSDAPNLPSDRVGAVTSIPGTPPNIHLVAPIPNGEWKLPAGDYANTRFSSLDLLGPNNVSNLKVVTTVSTGAPHGHEGNPLVVGDTMYVVTPFPNNLLAIDLTKPAGALRYIYEPHPDREYAAIRNAAALLDTRHRPEGE